jgi:hypothetical protein
MKRAKFKRTPGTKEAVLIQIVQSYYTAIRSEKQNERALLPASRRRRAETRFKRRVWLSREWAATHCKNPTLTTPLSKRAQSS